MIGLLAPILLGAAAIADETTSPSAVILLQKCSIEYDRATPVGANSNVGLIQECLVRPGDRVKAGQVLGRLFNKDVLAEMEVRATALESSEIAIHQREATLEVARAKLRRAEALISRNCAERAGFPDPAARGEERGAGAEGGDPGPADRGESVATE